MFQNLKATDYQIYIRDEYNCLFKGPSLKVSQPDKISAKVEPLQTIKCFNDSTASIKITASGGTGNLFYTIDNGENWKKEDGVFNNLPAKIYNVAVKDDNSCTTSKETVNIKQPDKLIIKSLKPYNISPCFGDSTGVIKIVANGGTLPYFYSIDGGKNFQTGNEFVKLKASDYQIIVKDIKSCFSSESSIKLTQPSQLTINEIVKKDITTCNGDSKGEILIKASGGISPLSYSINGGVSFHQNSGNFTSLKADSYQVIVKDNLNCQSSKNDVKIKQPPAIVIDTVFIKNINCFGEKTGFIKINTSGGYKPYSFSIDNGLNFTNTSSEFNDLQAKIYDVVVKDSKQCKSVVKPVEILQPSDIKVDKLENIPVSGCSTDSTGKVNVAASGGTGQLMYSIDNGYSWKSDGNFEKLKSAVYQVDIKDKNLCAASTGTFEIAANPPLEIESVTSSNLKCYNDSTGTISIFAKGGSGVYYYSIDDGKNFVNNNVINRLSAGWFHVKVKDSQGCSVTGNRLLITQPTPLGIFVDSVNHVKNCANDTTGFIITYATGGYGKYEFSVNNQSFTNHSGAFYQLTSGTYKVNVIDQNHCLVSTKPIEITAPAQILIDSIKATDITCYGFNDGKIQIFSSGGSFPLYYSFDNQEYTNTSSVFQYLGKGDYQVKVKDSNGCKSASNNVKINNPQKIIIDTLIITPVSTCAGDNTGSLRVTAKGGTGKLNYSVNGKTSQQGYFQELRSSNYSIKINDENNCMITIDSVFIEEPDSLKIKKLITQDSKCYGKPWGSIDFEVFGGIAPYTFSIDSGLNFITANHKIDSLIAKTYFPVVKDKNNCLAFSSPVTIYQLPENEIDSISIENIQKCFGDSTGILKIFARGNTDTLLYNIDNHSFSQNNDGIFQNIPAGIYKASVTDLYGCSIETETIEVLQPSKLQLDTIITFSTTCFDRNNGSIVIKPKGGSYPYLYSIDNSHNKFSNDSVFQDLKHGDYKVIIKDLNDCSMDTIITITRPKQLSFDTIVTNNILNCYGDKTGSIEFKVSGGTGKIQSSVNDTVNYKNNFFYDNLVSGMYLIRIVDENNCKLTSDTMYISQPQQITIDSLIKEDITCNGLKNGIITAKASGGTGTLKYSINENDTVFTTNNIFKNLESGRYSIFIKDINNCLIKSKLVEIIEPQDLVIQLSDLQNIDCFGNNNGSISINIQGGENRDLFTTWSNGSNEMIINNLGAEKYSVTTIDRKSNVCAFAEFEISQPDTFVANLNISTASCKWNSDGTAQLEVKGGTSPYIINWYTADNEMINRSNEMMFGKYKYSVTDFNNCLLTDTFSISYEECKSQIATYNVVTLNGDEKNRQLFEVQHIKKLSCYIYNRYGRLLHKTSFSANEDIPQDIVIEENSIKLDLENSNLDIVEGVYYYVLETIDYEGIKKTTAGFFHLLK